MSTIFRVLGAGAISAALAWLLSTINFSKQFSKLPIWFQGAWPLVIVSSFYYGFLSIGRHMSLGTHAFDLGIFTQVIYKYSHFSGLFNTVRGVNILSDHFHPILMFLAPLWWLWPSPNMLLALQAFVVCLGAWVVYKIVFDEFSDRWTAWCFTVAYLLSPGLQGMLGFDFHEIFLAPLAILLLYYFFNKKQWVGYWIVFGLALLIKEDVALYLLAWSIFILAKYRNNKIALPGIVATVIYFVIVTQLVMPILPGASKIKVGYFDFSSLGATPWDVMKNLILHPINVLKQYFSPIIKLQTMIILLTSIGWLAVLAPVFLVAAAPMLFEQFLFDVPTHWELEYHYAAAISAVLILASIQGYRYVSDRFNKQKWIKILPAFVMLSSISVTILTHAFATHLAKPSRWWPGESEKEALSLAKTIPADVSVAASHSLVPHLANREQIVAWPPVTSDNDKNLTSDYAIFTTAGVLWPEEEGEQRVTIQQLIDTDQYGIVGLSKDSKTVVLRKTVVSDQELLKQWMAQ